MAKHEHLQSRYYDLEEEPLWRITLSNFGSTPHGFEITVDDQTCRFFSVQHALAYVQTNDRGYLYYGSKGRRPVEIEINSSLVDRVSPGIWHIATRARYKADETMRRVLALTKPARLVTSMRGKKYPTRLFFLELLRDAPHSVDELPTTMVAAAAAAALHASG